MRRLGKPRSESRMQIEEFLDHVARMTAAIAGHPLDDRLDRDHGPGSAICHALRRGCEAGVATGWLCHREADGIRYDAIDLIMPLEGDRETVTKPCCRSLH